VVFDEAHQLPATASLFFGETVGTGLLFDLCRDVRVESAISAGDFKELPHIVNELEIAAKQLRMALGPAQARMAAARGLERTEFRAALDVMTEALIKLNTLLASQAERSDELKKLHERCRESLDRLERWLSSSTEKVDSPEKPPESVDSVIVRWLEVTTHLVLFHSTPLNAGELFARQIEGDARAWIFTSATLSVRKDFSHYLHEIGLKEAETAVWDSPFDYEKQALLYVPESMPDPNSTGYTEAVVEAAWPILLASGGRAFMLFTSLRAMNEAHRLLQARMAKRDHPDDTPYPLLVQGEKSRTDLLDEFRRLGNAVLLGSQSFWEGVDVAGDALSLVVIDRLPFQSPDDPVLAARMEAMKRVGKNPFFDYQLPHAVISLKQGAGRLIRRESDRGVLMICDPRLVDKSYGRRIWQALPPMKRTRKREDAIAFFAPLVDTE
jgi:ATP-dependent DNA helicase DinG